MTERGSKFDTSNQLGTDCVLKHGCFWYFFHMSSYFRLPRNSDFAFFWHCWSDHSNESWATLLIDQKSWTAAKATLNVNFKVQRIAHLQGLFKTCFTRFEDAPFFAAWVSVCVSSPASSWKAVSWLTSKLASWTCFRGPSISSDSSDSDSYSESSSDSESDESSL